MAIKIGELLLSEGLITQTQLDEALRCHVVFGIKLGSCMIELGIIQEDQLVALLSKKLGVPAITKKELFSVPWDVIKRVSRTLAERFNVVPVRLEGNRLYVAMNDPTDLKAQEELGFITGYSVFPLIAPEKLLFSAHEKYYGTSPDYRYTCAEVELRRRKDLKEMEGDAEGGNPLLATGEPVFTISNDFSNLLTRNDLLSVPISSDLYRSETVEAKPPVEPRKAEEPKQEAEPKKLTPQQTIAHYSVDQLSIDFSNARSRDDVADVFIKYLGQEFDKCALMSVRGSRAVGWSAVSNGTPVQNFEAVVLNLPDCAEFSEVLVGKHYFLGPLAETEQNLPFIRALGVTPGTTVLSLPVAMDNRVVALIVVSSDSWLLQHRLNELKKLMYKASLTFQILVLKDKLLQT